MEAAFEPATGLRAAAIPGLFSFEGSLAVRLVPAADGALTVDFFVVFDLLDAFDPERALEPFDFLDFDFEPFDLDFVLVDFFFFFTILFFLISSSLAAFPELLLRGLLWASSSSRLFWVTSRSMSRSTDLDRLLLR